MADNQTGLTPPGQHEFTKGLARLPKWILALGLAGTGVAGRFFGLNAALGFLLGAAGAYLNLRAIARFADRLVQLAVAGSPPARMSTVWFFIRFLWLVAGAFVILRVSGLNI